MTVLLVDPWGHGGISVFYALLADYLRSHGVVVDAFCYMSAWPDRYLLAPVCSQLAQSPVSLTEVLCNNSYDIVHMSTDCFAHPLSAAVHLSRAQFAGGLVTTSHYCYEAVLPDMPRHRVVAVSESAAESLRARNGLEVQVIPNGIDPGTYAQSEATAAASAPILAWVGRAGDEYAKDVSGFLYLASSLKDTNYRFAIVDGSPERSRQMQRLADWFGPRVTYIHRMPHSELRSFYASVAASGGALVSTSVQEAHCLTVLEAWASGCPTIVPRVKGFEYAARHEVSFVYDRDNAIPAILGLLPQLSDSKTRNAIVARARQAVESEFSAARMGEQYLAIYQGLVGTSARRRPIWTAAPRAFWRYAARTRTLIAQRRSAPVPIE